MNKKHYSILFLALLALIVITYILFPYVTKSELIILHPFDGAVFPADMAPPLFFWDDSDSGAEYWNVRIVFRGSTPPMEVQADENKWIPSDDRWKTIRELTREKPAKVTVSGYKKLFGFGRVCSKKTITIRTSRDRVEAPIFFRSVTLPFEFAVKNMDTIKWCVGDVSSEQPPHVVLENMHMCGNCHSFPRDGNTLAMDVDYANDKGSYVITGVTKDIYLTQDVIITWSDYMREDKEPTFGLLSQISPCGRYVVSTVKDRSVFVPKSDKYYSQLFFPLKGILAWYSVETGTFHDLPGANDRYYVQSNPSWNPDCTYIVFARSPADTLKKYGDQVVLTQEQCDDYLNRGKKFRYDLCRIPFNNGNGGEAVPLEGASGNGKSNYFAKYSPDGRWIVFCQSDSFMLLQPDSRLFIIPAEGGKAREMNCNTSRMNSWHSWSPNGRWLVFSSKAFGPYTQLFLTHIDEEGNDSPPVLLHRFTSSDRAANIPEFLNAPPGAIGTIHERFKDDYTYVRSGYNYSIFGDFDRAAEEYQIALNLNPKNLDARHKLGNIYLDKKDFDRAEEQFSAIIETSPGYKFADYLHYQLGVIYKNKGDLDRARKEFETVLSINPRNVRAYYELGFLAIRREDYKRAESMFGEMIRFIHETLQKNPASAEDFEFKEIHVLAHAGMGNLYRIQKEYDKAIVEFDEVVHIDPRNFKGFLSLGNLYFTSGNIEKAIVNFEKALALDPSAKGLAQDIAQMKRLQQER